MFIRIKHIKQQPYAYKVRNKWTKKGTRQKTAGYLGRVFYLNPVKDLTFEEFIHNEFNQDLTDYMKSSSSRVVIQDLVRFELIKQGFIYKGKNRNILLYLPNMTPKKPKKGNKVKSETLIKVELAQSFLNITNVKKPIVLALNNDFLCNYTLRKLMRFKSFSSEEECGRELARVFIAAGIHIVPSLFVEVFQKVYSRGGSYVK
ncbi:hypothetical protein HN695_01505 [Candidatus Woesearchaeota archaeon]|jgi:hypothetical protein|nr:hypothetical protein [Candidatus Woesearchaeota archaeon]MBT5273076.1 hypothetical protein [Candidatus Woesearchaeota archaeon]MBT6041015.1 hypothetical protein [Candidatus Woesearchaeota archaeon]MBT6337609.1 hypothetical protein [Candidatus Woesearchaeota archaeon]MBT7926990.1 hypothetical protein [Candidatus Woesearchaeota archaeon]